ncbi:bifunctional DNA primase/polymerase [Nocardioides sp. Arc9.136]|uniref:bifunctional DNA primase/polymerase n=1 Tax=Nocardioides sp. Arc9.136 TaxID=2996826 RepID=UPI0026667E61|nr:bifunctional DNA primase/polymerase [Nocardioides sp. Arc9.136]WKN48844.1 bifunctional DNA primase/polymerase [Nocardioides sp. Arc9.136]
MQEWGEWLAGRGCHVFPLTPGGKTPAISASWTNAASRDSAKITKWFAASDRNIGVHCGRSGLLVVDEDEPGAFERFATQAGHEVPKTLVVRTGKGKHFYFRVPDGLQFGNGRGPLSGCDVRAGNGYVVGPGSVHESGAKYEPDDLDAPVAPMPDWLVDALTPEPARVAERVAAPAAPGYAEVALRDEVRSVRNAREGTRNETLNGAAFNLGQLAAGGALHPDEVQTALLDAALTAGLDEASSRKTIKSGFDAGAASPRSGPAATPVDAGAWEPLDLAQWFRSPPPPAQRFGSGQMLYRGALHWLAGEPESGKSILMLQWALEEMRLGNNVVLLDEEAGPRDVFAKLQALGASPDLLASHLTYLPPAGRNLLREAETLRDVVGDRRATFVGVDGAAAHLAIADLNEDSATDVTKFVVRGLLPLAHSVNASVVVLDHMTKSVSNTRYARGSGAKLAKADAAYYVEAVQPFSKVSSGRVRITSTKDRLGEFGRNAVWDVNVDTSDSRIRLGFSHLTTEEAASISARASRGPNPGKDAGIRTDVVSFLRANPGASTRALREAKIAGKDALERVLNEMREAGEIRVDSAGHGGAPRKHFLNEPAIPGMTLDGSEKGVQQ